MSILPPQPVFSFVTGTGTALHKNKPIQSCIACRKRKNKCDRLQPCTPCKNRGEADQCMPPVKEPQDRPTGYTHVSDTSILANRVHQLELILSRLICRLDKQEAYNDLVHNFKAPYPIYRPNKKDERGQSEQAESSSHETAASIRARPAAHEISDVVIDPDDLSALSTAIDTSSLGNDMSSEAILQLKPPLSSIFSDVTLSQPDFPSQPQSLVTSRIGDPSQVSVISNWGDALDIDLQMPPPMSPGVAMGNEQGFRSMAMDIERFTSQPPGANVGHSSHNLESYSKAPSANEHEALLALEGMALGRQYMSNSTARAERELEANNVRVGVGEPSPGSPPTFSSFIQHKQQPDGAQWRPTKKFPQVDQLPTALVGRFLIDFFYDRVIYLWRCTHLPTWKREQANLLSMIRTTKNPDFSSEDLFTIALYAASLAVALHFLDEECYLELGIDEKESASTAERCWDISRQALEAADWMQVHNIKSCQTVIIIGLYLCSIRRADQHWTMLGVANKIAMSLGLTSIPDEDSVASMTGQQKLRWSSAIDREVGRRVWYCLVEHDWLFGMEHNFLYTLHEDLYSTSEPANVDDIDIVPDSCVVSKPHEVYTEMSYSRQRTKMLYPLRTLIMSVRRNGRIRYNHVLQAHEEIMQAIRNKPNFFKSSSAPLALGFDADKHAQLARERQATEEGENLRLIRIHRYYFPSSCLNVRYEKTKQTCLDCARCVLSWRNQPAEKHLTLDRFWAQVYATLAATVIMVIYVQYARNDELEDIKSQVECGIKQIEDISKRGHSDVGDTADVIKQLLVIQLQRRQRIPAPLVANTLIDQTGRKRTFEQFAADFTPTWQHAVDFPTTGQEQTGGVLGPSSVLDDTELRTFLSTWLDTVSTDDQELDMSMWS